jgi:hypothetical protein
MFRKAKQNRIFQDVVDQTQIRTGVAGGSLSTEQVSESLAFLIRYQRCRWQRCPNPVRVWKASWRSCSRTTGTWRIWWRPSEPCGGAAR